MRLKVSSAKRRPFCLGLNDFKRVVRLLISPLCGIYASVDWVSIGSENGLLPIRRQNIKQMLEYRQIDPKIQTSLIFECEYKTFHLIMLFYQVFQ